MAKANLQDYFKTKAKAGGKNRIQAPAYVTVGKDGVYQKLQKYEVDFTGHVKLPKKDETAFRIDLKVDTDTKCTFRGADNKAHKGTYNIKGKKLNIEAEGHNLTFYAGGKLPPRIQCQGLRLTSRPYAHQYVGQFWVDTTTRVRDVSRGGSSILGAYSYR